MGRRRRADPPSGWHHVVNRGVARGDIFFADCDRVDFGRLLGEAHERFGFTVHAYCLMSNHYHLLVECPEGGLSASMQLIGSRYVRHLNDRLGRDGPLFRSRFFARPVAAGVDLVTVARYIHRNPVAIVGEAGLEAYRWSSLRTYLGHRRPPHWMETAVVAELVGGAAGMRDLVLGGQQTRPITPEQLHHFVALSVDDHFGDVRSNRVDRTVLTYLLDAAGPSMSDTIRSTLSFPTTAAEQSARSRARRRAHEQPAVGQAAADILRAVA